MGERRKWDKQQDAFLPSNGVGTSACVPDAATVDPVLEKQVQYIKMLEERNRLKKKLAAASKKETREKQREDAFVTTFNVPATNATTNVTLQDPTVRKNKSSASLLPTRMHTQTTETERVRGRSAPSTTLPVRMTPRNGDEDDRAKATKPESTIRRAKWSKPTPGEAFGIENRNGKARLWVGAKDDDVSPPFGVGTSCVVDNENDGSEDEYLEESFEDFEAMEETSDHDQSDEKIQPSGVIDALQPTLAQYKHSEETTSSVSIRARAEAKDKSTITVAKVDASSSAGLSRTTTDLFSVIQNLSRSKQKALVDVLQKFESSAQQESDVHTLQSSIGDPAIWKQVTVALFGNSETDDKNQQSTSSDAKPAPTVAQLMEEQRKWEEEYARQMQQRLAEEREAKEKVLREAEQRRLHLMQQMEEEEKELERLMEQKRLQRLARMKALEQEDEGKTVSDLCSESKRIDISRDKMAENDRISTQIRLRIEPRAAIETDENTQGVRSSSGGIGVSHEADAGDIPPVPKLNLPPTRHDNATQSTFIELRIRLLSTWGKTRAVGLTQLCVYDASGGEIDIDVSRVRIYERTDGRHLPKSHEMMRSISRLFNGIAQTNNDQDMWLGRLSDHGMLEIAVDLEKLPSKLCVWNYNSKMCSACARDVEILVSGRSIWSGSLPQGFGDEDDNLCTWISVGQGVKKTARAETSRVARDQEKLTPEAFNEEKSNIDMRSSRHDGEKYSSDHDSSAVVAPIWLKSSTSSSSLTAPGIPQVKVDSKEYTLRDLDDQHTPSNTSGSLTSRRQRGDTVNYEASSTRPSFARNLSDANESKTENRDPIGRDEFLARKERERLSGTGALTSSWDTLEHFSKTNRSRLPSTTEESPVVTAPITMIDEPTKTKFMPATTSALLAELRGTVTHTSPAQLVHPVSVPIKIPELPSGRRLKLEIITTWGDQFYVGLNGVEIFDQRGKLVTFSNPDRQIIACPSSINVLDEYEDDPRLSKNLVDGVNSTCDDFHMWLAPYTEGEDHHVMMLFDQTTSISMVRVWNYNKSRAHTYRGVRNLRLLLFDDLAADRGRVIFEGEIKRAPGGLFRDERGDNVMWCEVLLFTTDQAILRKIEANDALLQAYGHDQEEEEATSVIVTNMRSSMELRRPKTADNGTVTNNSGLSSSQVEDSPVPQYDADKRRPTTSAKRLPGNVDVRKSVDTWMAEEPQQKSPVLTKIVETKEDKIEEEDCECLIRGRRIVIRLLSTWGDRNYIGLTQLDVLVGNHGTPIPLDLSHIDATPRDLATLGYDGDPRTLHKLINGTGTTSDDANMWLVPFSSNPEIRIDLKREQFIYGVRIWNYNKSLEDSFRGVKQMTVTIDGELISPRQTGFVLRKAPGLAYFDFDQIVRFGSSEVGDKRDRAYIEKVVCPSRNSTYKSPNVKQDYEPVLYPQGFVLKLVLWSTWGDPYYIGLNGFELYDANGKRITLKPSIITAQPHSLADIDQQASSQDDSRVPENLLSGKNKNTWDASDAWLAPLASSLGSTVGNIVYAVFDTPIVLSLVKFWNYSKTPERGVKDFDIYLDDLHVFSGTLRKAPHGNGGQNIGRFGPKQVVMEEFSQPILFSTNQAQVDAEKRRVHYCGTEEQDVLCINEGQVVQESKAMYRKPDPGAEGVVVDLGQRPMTAMCRK